MLGVYLERGTVFLIRTEFLALDVFAYTDHRARN